MKAKEIEPSTKTSSEADSIGERASIVGVTEFGWKPLYHKYREDGPSVVRSDEQRICDAISWLGARAIPTAGRNNSHDLEVTLGVEHIEPGFYEVKKLHIRSSGKSADRRFKAGMRGERIYGRRDGEIKSFAIALENYLDSVLWGVNAVTDTHDFIDQALQRRHGKRFNERLTRLAKAAVDIPTLVKYAWPVLKGDISSNDVANGFSSLSGIFVMAGTNYTLVKPQEYTRFIGFDSASAEGPKLSFQGVIPLEENALKKEKGKRKHGNFRGTEGKAQGSGRGKAEEQEVEAEG